LSPQSPTDYPAVVGAIWDTLAQADPATVVGLLLAGVMLPITLFLTIAVAGRDKRRYHSLEDAAVTLLRLTSVTVATASWLGLPALTKSPLWLFGAGYVFIVSLIASHLFRFSPVPKSWTRAAREQRKQDISYLKHQMARLEARHVPTADGHTTSGDKTDIAHRLLALAATVLASFTKLTAWFKQTWILSIPRHRLPWVAAGLFTPALIGAAMTAIMPDRSNQFAFGQFILLTLLVSGIGLVEAALLWRYRTRINPRPSDRAMSYAYFLLVNSATFVLGLAMLTSGPNPGRGAWAFVCMFLLPLLSCLLIHCALGRQILTDRQLQDARTRLSNLKKQRR
jgi:hypothetical protein